MMFGGHEEEDESVKELDAVHAGDAHVKEHAKEDREGDEFEYGGKHHWTAWTSGRTNNKLWYNTTQRTVKDTSSISCT